jgi:ABC-type thiamine transport system substrate-binding protein
LRPQQRLPVDQLKPGKPADSKVDEFICYVLSREGQQIVPESNIYFALSHAMAREQLATLD